MTQGIVELTAECDKPRPSHGDDRGPLDKVRRNRAGSLRPGGHLRVRFTKPEARHIPELSLGRLIIRV